ncbi:replication initiation protein [Campylobacter jejuni]|uniref:Replication initiation protein n=1 Tax=Campylobacter jejuni TaxID=197 RepID=A0A5T1QRR5_CAMJU|nr:replication initiation protein [Campylobacter jejuni]EAL4010437.1 replication initiation protein [Campylobacter jejuni]EAL4015629.1 replication initiation protein [Campylobacter jejuni]EAL4022527.1 replication initiation protein [Campylobacter jejuni]
MSDIVKYHNDFNKIKLPSFTEIEQDLLCGLMVKLKEEKNKVTFYPSDLRNILKSSYDNKSLLEFSSSLKEKFFKADFTIIEKTTLKNGNKEKKVTAHRTINLFTEFVVYIFENEDTGKNELDKIEIQVNPRFEYILNQLTANFTAFELAEFIALSGKYTKTLYRLLKQYRTTGTARFEWNEFCRIMDIPEKLAMCDIDKRILKPAVKELSQERNLFDQIRVPFKNLAYEKEKEKGTRGRGGKVSAIIFSFKPENSNMQKLEKEVNKKATLEQQIIHTCNEMLRTKIKFEYQDKIYQVLAFDIEKLSLQCVEMIRDEYENLVNSAYREFTAKDKEQFKRMLDTFMSNIY